MKYLTIWRLDEKTVKLKFHWSIPWTEKVELRCSISWHTWSTPRFDLIACLQISIFLNVSDWLVHTWSQAKAALTKYFKHLMKERKSQGNAQDDFLAAMLEAQEDPQVREEVEDFDDNGIADNLVQFWFGANETTSTTLTWVLKYLVEYPEVFRRVQVRSLIFENREWCRPVLRCACQKSRTNLQFNLAGWTTRSFWKQIRGKIRYRAQAFVGRLQTNGVHTESTYMRFRPAFKADYLLEI